MSETTQFVGAQSLSEPLLSAQVLEALRAVPGDRPWLTATAIRATMPESTHKADVNRCLYALRAEGKVDIEVGTPPRWRLSCDSVQPQMPPMQQAMSVLVIVDLGNCHDCLHHLVEYARKGILQVRAYADLTFSGYGVNPPITSPNVAVFQSTTPDKNSADVQIIWDTCLFVQKFQAENKDKLLEIFVATKDLGFQRLRYIVEEDYGYRLHFVKNWETLRVHIE